MKQKTKMAAFAGLASAGALATAFFAGTGAPQVSVAEVNPGTSVERSLCLSVSLAPAAASECGDLRLAHALPAVRTLGQARAPVLLYNSQHASPRPIVAANVTLPDGTSGLSRVTATLKVNGKPRAQGVWRGATWPAGTGPVRIAVDYDARSDATGPYRYTLEVKACYGTDCRATTAAGQLAVVNRQDSPFGAGWWLAGLERLVLDPSGQPALWVGGDGSTRRYTAARGDSVWGAPSLDRPDTLKRAGTGWVRLVGGGVREHFDAAGRHDSTVNRLGRRTAFLYDSAGRLDTITIPQAAAGQGFAFRYGADRRLDRVESPGIGGVARVTKIHRAGARVDSIADPDLSRIRFGYADATSLRVASRTDRRKYRTDFRYGAALRLTGSKLWMDTLATGDSIVMKLTVPEARGLADAGGNGALHRDSAYALIDGPRPDSDVLDHTRLWVDRWGAPVRIRDAGGHVTSTTRGDARYPALVTRVDYPNQRVVAAEYDARGNLAAQTDSSHWREMADGTRKYATTRYERTDPDWPDFVTQVTLPEGEVTRMGYHTNGSPAWQQPGTSATHRASFGYNAAGQVESILSAGATIPTRLYYDPVSGNLERMVTPLGIETRYRADELGRDTLVDAPVDAYRRLKTITHYDVMGFDTLSISDGDALEGDLYVRTERNRNGQPLLVERWSTVDSIQIGTVRRSWQYDAVGRLAVEVDEADAPLRHHYDAAGNDTLTISRRSYLLRTRYDVLNRPVERITPPVTYERWVRGIAGIRARSGQVSEDTFPYYPFTAPDSAFVIPGDTVKFAYDPVTGQMTRADNRYAQIRRGYNRNGTLSVDTTRVRTWDLSAWSATPHEYVMRYEYDLNGRRTRLTLPDNLAPEPGRQHQDYAYDPVWGGLRQVRSAMGLEYGFRYNLEGAADTIRYPGNRVETFSYDLDGRRTRRLMTQGSYVIGDAAFTLNENGSNKVVVELGALAEYINEVRYDYTYTQLGRLRQAKTKRIGSGKPLGPQRLEDYSWDALGNRWKSHVHGLVGSATHPTISSYRHGTNRVTFSTPPSGTTDNVNINQSSYDAAGNVDWFGGTTYASGNEAVHIDESVTRSYYSADEKLHAAETRRCKSEVPLNSGTADEDPDPPYCLAPYLLSNAASGSFEWYRYDALGRRIMVRTRRDPWCGSATCSSPITRFIWDGDQVLAEIRGEGGADYSETPNQTGPQYGRVVYTHGGGLDQPLDIMRSSGVGGAAGILLPIPTWRGTFVTATDSAGNMVCAPWVYCEITFTGAHSSAFLLPGAAVAGEYWYGSLAQGNENASGTIYMRNRYYNPQTGAFTQQDPIGLAGGLNTYGFANGDPVTYSDPYGLSPDTVWVAVRPLANKVLGLLGNHAAILVGDRLGKRQLGELLNVDNKNFISVRTNPGEGDLGRYDLSLVQVPDGMSSEQFDFAVQKAFNQVASEVRHKQYSSHGARNSNRFVYDVITRAGGSVPKSADRPPFTPGICGGNPKNRLDSGDNCKD